VSGYSISPLRVCELMWIGWGLYWFVAARFTKRDATKEPIGKRIGHLTAQVLAFALTFGAVPFTHVGELPLPLPLPSVGVVLTAASLGLAVWARVHLGAYWSGRITIKEGHQVIRTGPYALMRHPIYAAIIFGMLGAAMSSGHAGHLLGPLVMTAAYVVKIRREEKTLIEQLPGYDAYRREVKAIVPFVL
jgi:protein-S-isoprenylcysteine O-methyltransferase Ste14